MSIPVPNLDDRTFTDLVEAGRRRIQQIAPDWTDLSVHDPGIALLEAFAHLTDTLAYRLNRVPDRLYAVYLNLLGTSLRPPAAATVTLEFTRDDGTDRVLIPLGTRVEGPPGPPGIAQPVFATLTEATLEPGATSVQVTAADVSLRAAVVAGAGSGQPGQSFSLPDAPLVEGPGVSIGIEVPAGTTVPDGAAITAAGKTFWICREVDVFADAGPGEAVVRIDRSGATITFPWFTPGDGPQPVVPQPGAQVRAWYRFGGGERGNVPAGRLTVLRDPLPGDLKVSNPAPATGGRDGEALDAALLRAPQDFQARDRAVTARDYEVLATRHGGVARARAITRREVWAFAAPGEVEVVLIPRLPQSMGQGARIGVTDLQAYARDDVKAEVESYLRARATIGAEPVVHWGQYKEVLVQARVVVRADEDAVAVPERIVQRLNRMISPVRDLDTTAGTSAQTRPGSDFGRALRVSNLYRALEQAEPGVLYVDNVRLELGQAPDRDASRLVQAQAQPDLWFVAQNDTLFRTVNAGDGWDACSMFPGERIRAIEPYPVAAPGRAPGLARPGLMALITLDENADSKVRVSEDLGETWRQVAAVAFELKDLAWVDRSGTPALLLAGENGLYELTLASDAVPVQNLVDTAQPALGFTAIESFTDLRGQVGVLIAAQASGGVWLSTGGGTSSSFHRARPPGEDIRFLSVQYDGPTVFAWIGRAVAQGTGTGCSRLRIDELERLNDPAQVKWQEFTTGWTGGTCWDIATAGNWAFASTQSGGVLQLNLQQVPPAWVAPGVNSGLSLRDRTRFDPVTGVSAALRPDGSVIVLACGPPGVYRSLDQGGSWRPCASRISEDVVTLPGTWLFCSGEHRVEVVTNG